MLECTPFELDADVLEDLRLLLEVSEVSWLEKTPSDELGTELLMRLCSER